MTIEDEMIKVFIRVIKEFKENSILVQKSIMENAVHQTQLYEQILIEIKKQTEILERNTNIRYV